MEWTARLRAAERVARMAGERLLTARGISVSSKGYHDFVTETDLETEHLIRSELLSEFPEDGFYGEETGGDDSAAGRWIVDPIDGTTNFIRGIPQFSVSIAYEAEGEIVLGVVYAPALCELFSAAKGCGATLNGKLISVSGETQMDRAVSGMSFAHRYVEANLRMMGLLPKLCLALNDLRRIGSAAIDLCYVACGRLDAFLELGLKPYDIAAGLLIVREAGGIVTGWPGELDCTVTGNILAGTPAIHAHLAEIIVSKGA